MSNPKNKNKKKMFFPRKKRVPVQIHFNQQTEQKNFFQPLIKVKKQQQKTIKTNQQKKTTRLTCNFSTDKVIFVF